MYKLTVMRTGIYAVLAVVIGVMLVGMLPSQLSNFAAPAVIQTSNLQSGSAPEVGNKTAAVLGTVISGRGFSNSSIPDTITIHDNTTKFFVAPLSATGASTANQSAATASSTDAALAAEAASSKTYTPYADLGYYAMWGVGLVAALSVYFVSKRMLG